MFHNFEKDTRGIHKLEHAATASHIGILKQDGNLDFGLADVSILEKFNSERVKKKTKKKKEKEMKEIEKEMNVFNFFIFVIAFVHFYLLFFNYYFLFFFLKN